MRAIKNPTGKGGFKLGVSGNPGGRPKVVHDVIALARIHAPAAINALVDVMQNSTKDQARVAAANALLDRGYGRPKQELEHAGLDGAALVPILNVTISNIDSSPIN